MLYDVCMTCWLICCGNSATHVLSIAHSYPQLVSIQSLMQEIKLHLEKVECVLLCCRLPVLPQTARCHAVWALATLNHNPGQHWLTSFTAAAMHEAEVKLTQRGDLADAMWALHHFGHPISDHMLRGLCERISKHVSQLSIQQVQRVTWLLADCGYQLPAGIGDEISKILSARVADLSHAELAAVAWAAAKLALRLPARDQMFKRLYGALGSLPGADVARTFWAASQLGYHWLQPQIVEFDSQSRSKFDHLTGADVAQLLQGFEHYRYTPSAEWLSLFAEQPAERVRSLTTSQLLSLSSSLDKVGVPVTQVAWLKEWLATLDPNAVTQLSADELAQFTQLLHAQSAGNDVSSSYSRSQDTSSSYSPSEQLLGLLTLSISRQLQLLNTQQLYSILTSLASWHYSPADSTLLPGLAGRLCEKLPALSAGQVASVMSSFAALGYSLGGL